MSVNSLKKTIRCTSVFSLKSDSEYYNIKIIRYLLRFKLVYLCCKQNIDKLKLGHVKSSFMSLNIYVSFV